MKNGEDEVGEAPSTQPFVAYIPNPSVATDSVITLCLTGKQAEVGLPQASGTFDEGGEVQVWDVSTPRMFYH